MHQLFNFFIITSSLLVSSICESMPDEDTLDEMVKRRFSLKHLAGILGTSLEDEVDLADREIENFWGDMTKYQWTQNYEAEASGEAVDGSPFIICNEAQGSGFDRVMQIKNSILEIDDNADVSKLDGDSTKVILYNSNRGAGRTIGDRTFYGRTCVGLQLSMTIAESLATTVNTYTICPSQPAAKMVGGTLKTLQELFESDEEQNFPDIVINFCDKTDLRNTTLDNDGNIDATDIIEFITSPKVADKSFWTYIGDEYDDIATVKRAREYWTTAAALGADGIDDSCKSLIDNLQFTPNFYENSVTVAIPSDIVDTAKNLGVDENCALVLLLGLSILNDICTIELVKRVETSNLNAQWLVQTGVPDERPWFDKGLDGTGQVVACSDTGVDLDNCYFWDKENGPVKRDGSYDPTQRKVVSYRAYVNNDDYENGHGTHVAGTILGKKAADGITETPGLADGVAPGAKLAFIDIGDSNGALSIPSSSTLLDTGSEGGAKIHSASWGSQSNGYGYLARGFDEYLYNNENNLALIAAGNSGGGNTFNSVGEPATAKNVLAVGASHSYGSDLGRGMLGPTHIASFSSKGRTADSRTKPDVVAPGFYILSAAARPNVIGECDPVTGPPGANSNKDGLLSIAGTSMATPVTAGTAAIIRQYFLEGYYPSGQKNATDSRNPSGALVKAVIMNGAQYMSGVDNGGVVYPTVPYDDIQNFGRISLIDSLYLVNNSNTEAIVDEHSLQGGSSQTYNITVQGTCTNLEILSATLVWSDPPAAQGCTVCVLNDLDIKIEKTVSGEVVDTYFPNGLNRPDDRNNAERIRLDGRPGQAHEGLVKLNDTFVITVTANNLVTNRQKYALVITGCFGGKGNIIDTTVNSVFSDDDLGNDSWLSDLVDNLEDFFDNLEDETLYAMSAAGILFVMLLCVCCYVCCQCFGREKEYDYVRA